MSSLLLASAFRRFPTIALHHSSKSASVLLLPKTCGNPSVLLARVSRLNTGVCLSKESSMASIYEFDLKKEVERDVLLYQHRRQGHFKMVQGFAFIQVLLWVYLGSFCAMYLLPGPSPEEEQKRILEKDESLKESMGFKVLLAISDFAADYRKVLAILFFICGYGIFAACSMYTTRSIQAIILRRGGDKVSLYTSYIIPSDKKLNQIDVPLRSISCNQTREEATQYIAMKIKDKRFFYLIDKKGSFSQTDLFDRSVGMRRNFRQ